MKNVIVTGGSGFIGSPLVARLREQGWRVVVVARQARPGVIGLDLEQEALPRDLLESAQAIIHLVGAPIFQRWTPHVKQAIYKSRIVSTRQIIASLREARHRPGVFITASATGYYGDRGETLLDESSASGRTFLARVAHDWEKEARKAQSLGLRTVQVRTAPVVGPGGFVRQLEPLYRLGLGGPFGDEQQWFPWVHLDDIVQVYLFALLHPELAGPVNAVAPDIVRQVEFARELGESMRRPHVVRWPRWALKAVLGEAADDLLASQRVVPGKLQSLGFVFRYPRLRGALESVYGE